MPSATLDDGQTSSVTPWLRQPLDQLVVERGQHAVPDPVRVQLIQAGPHAGRARRAHRRAGPRAGRRVRRCGRPGAKSSARPAPLVVAEPEAGHAAPRVLDRQPGQRARVERVPGPVRGDDDRRSPRRSPRWPRPRRRARARRWASGRRTARRTRTDRPGSPASGIPRPARPRRSRVSSRRRPPGCAAPTAPCRRAAGTGTSPARRRRSAPAATPRPAPRAGGRGGSRASSTSVECRIAPVRCRCRCALGS